MQNTRLCQSCGMPLNEEHKQYIAREKDGRESDYCTFCYRDGEFVDPGATKEDMIEMGVPELAKKIGEKAARGELSRVVPTLNRWKEK